MTRSLSTSARSFECWKAWERARPPVLTLEADAIELACRLARAQWRAGGTFLLHTRASPNTMRQPGPGSVLRLFGNLPPDAQERGPH